MNCSSEYIDIAEIHGKWTYAVATSTVRDVFFKTFSQKNMKKINLLLALSLLTTLAFGQEKFSDKKKIEVYGSAEMEVVPDELYFNITLKEYKEAGKKIELNKLESQLAQAVQKARIAKENFQVENISGYNWDWKKKRSDEFLASKRFRLKVKDLKMMNDLLASLDDKGINHVNVTQYDHSQMEKFENELKLQALQNAKKKAQALLEGIDEELGGVLEIQEIRGGAPEIYYPSARSSLALAKAESDYQSDVEFKSIQLASEIRAVFEIR